MSSSLLVVQHLKKRFDIAGPFFARHRLHVHAVEEVSLTVTAGETVGLVGESGCGKSTVAFSILRLLRPDAGEIWFEGTEISRLPERALRPLRRKMQLVFQDPYASLNPRMRVGEILEEPLLVHRVADRKGRRERVAQLLEQVGLTAEHAERFPHEFSGGQRQRIGIARAIALHPKLIVADEPVAALDVSIQGEILNLLRDLQRSYGLAYLFIAHDVKVVVQLSHRIAVMYLGRIVEWLTASEFYKARHPYTQALIQAIPKVDPGAGLPKPIEGDIPSPVTPPRGCPFHPRCPFRQGRCETEEPLLEAGVDASHQVACHFWRAVPVLELPR